MPRIEVESTFQKIIEALHSQSTIYLLQRAIAGEPSHACRAGLITLIGLTPVQGLFHHEDLGKVKPTIFTCFGKENAICSVLVT